MRNVLTVLILTTAALMAQQTSATLHGTVTDSSGALIPAANVALTADGVQRTAQTQTDGTYTFSGLTPGDYKVTLSLPGFTTFERSVTLQSGAAAQLSIQLTPGGGKQEVTISADAAEVSVEADHNASAIVVKESDLDALPDDPDDLNDMLTALAGPSAGINGPTMLVDGFTGGQLPPKNTIKEIRLNQNPFAAEYDDLGFGRIEIITKPGTDSLHGSFQLTDSDSFFNSRNPYAANKADYVNRAFSETLSDSFRHKGSWMLSANQGKIDNDAIIHAVTLDPSTLTSVPVDQSVITPRNHFNGAARFDYQLTANNSVTARYAYDRNDRENSGIGGYSLVSRAYSGGDSEHELRVTDTAVLSPSIATETRLGFTRDLSTQTDDIALPAIIVSGSFNAGAAQAGNKRRTDGQFEAQNITTWIHRTHTIRFGGRVYLDNSVDSANANYGGTFTFFGRSNVPSLDPANQAIPGSSISISSLEQYRRTLLFQKLGYTVQSIQSLGGGASQFSIAGGSPMAAASLTYRAGFIQDDWKILPNLTFSPGFRFDGQSNQHAPHGFGPRIGLAWSPDGAHGKPGKTVIRLGAGIFFDRFWVNPMLTSAHFNGASQQQYLVTDPQFFSSIPSLATLAAQQQTPVIYRLDPKIKALMDMMQAATFERQLPHNSTLSVTYLHITGNHVPILINQNAPLPGTYNPADPSSGIRPLGNAAGNVFEYQSNGIYNQKLTGVKWDERLGKKVSLTTNFTLRFAHNNANWLGTPSNPFNLMDDYARAPYDRRCNLSVLGTITTLLGLQVSPMLVVSSGNPYDVTIGTDRNGDSFATDRPAFATDLSRPSVVLTRFGNFDTDPLPGQKLVPRDYLVGAGMWNLNARLGKTFAFGEGKEKRYKLNFNIDVNNVFNHLNPGGYVGNLSSPLFGQSTSVNLFRETSNLRRVQFGTSFNF